MTTWTKILAGVNLIGALLCIALLVSTWFAQGIIVDHASKIAMDAVKAKAEPVFGILDSPIAAKLPVSVRQKLELEIAEYRASPDKWLKQIVEGDGSRAKDFEFPEIKNPFARMALGGITKFIGNAKNYFEKSYKNLIRDLRIFTGTNACALILAAIMCCVAQTPRARFWMSAWSIILLISTLLASGLYLDQSWVWSILFNSYFGWQYVGLHLAIFIYLASRILISLSSRKASRAS